MLFGQDGGPIWHDYTCPAILMVMLVVGYKIGVGMVEALHKMATAIENHSTPPQPPAQLPK